jgi:hypothetical protein
MKAHSTGLAAAALIAAIAFAPTGYAQTASPAGTTTGSTTTGDTATGATAAGTGMSGAPAGVTPGTTVGGPAPGATTGMTGPASSADHNPAVRTTGSMATQPAKGANSFTRAEARRRLNRHGFSDVSDLKKDTNGVWNATAKKDGASVNAWLDYKGNVGTH